MFHCIQSGPCLRRNWIISIIASLIDPKAIEIPFSVLPFMGNFAFFLFMLLGDPQHDVDSSQEIEDGKREYVLASLMKIFFQFQSSTFYNFPSARSPRRRISIFSVQKAIPENTFFIVIIYSILDNTYDSMKEAFTSPRKWNWIIFPFRQKPLPRLFFPSLLCAEREEAKENPNRFRKSLWIENKVLCMFYDDIVCEIHIKNRYRSIQLGIGRGRWVGAGFSIMSDFPSHPRVVLKRSNLNIYDILGASALLLLTQFSDWKAKATTNVRERMTRSRNFLLFLRDRVICFIQISTLLSTFSKSRKPRGKCFSMAFQSDFPGTLFLFQSAADVHMFQLIRRLLSTRSDCFEKSLSLGLLALITDKWSVSSRKIEFVSEEFIQIDFAKFNAINPEKLHSCNRSARD